MPPRSQPGTPTVMHLVPEHLASVRATVSGPLVIHTVWETDLLPSGWPALINGFDGLIVPSAWNRDVFAASGVRVPIEVVPMSPASRSRATRGAPLRSPTTLSSSTRSAAGISARRPRSRSRHSSRHSRPMIPWRCVTKTGPLAEVRPPDGWGRVAAVRRDRLAGPAAAAQPPAPAAHPPGRRGMGRGAHRRAAHRGDCYITLSHGEGWGIGSFDACVYGNPVIAPGWSAHLEYLAGSQTLVDYDLVAVSLHAAPRLLRALAAMGGGAPRARRRAAAPRRRRPGRRARGRAAARATRARALRRRGRRGGLHRLSHPARAARLAGR